MLETLQEKFLWTFTNYPAVLPKKNLKL
jgi:hypothetical protein